MRVFFDSSSFAKRFVEEPGSAEVETICGKATDVGLSVLCVPEIVSALNRRRRERTLTGDQYGEAKRRLLEDVRDADVVQLTPAVVASCVRVLEVSPVRALDAIHLGAALEWHADLFVSSDKRQVTAAEEAGLTTEQV